MVTMAPGSLMKMSSNGACSEAKSRTKRKGDRARRLAKL
jgi:hypothetical protein